MPRMQPAPEPTQSAGGPTAEHQRALLSRRWVLLHDPWQLCASLPQGSSTPRTGSYCTAVWLLIQACAGSAASVLRRMSFD
jgi:hypothetical protein